MELKTEDFLIDRDTATAKRITNRFNNFLDDQDRCRDSSRGRSNRIREKTFLLDEADKILSDPASTRSAKAFAGIVYAFVSEW